MKVRSTLLAMAATAAATLTTAVAAGPAAAETASIAVRYGDLDLASPAGRAMLDHRVFRAATVLCGQYDARGLSTSMPSRACRDEAIAGARGQREAALRTLGTGYARANPGVSQAAF